MLAQNSMRFVLARKAEKSPQRPDSASDRLEREFPFQAILTAIESKKLGPPISLILELKLRLAA